MSERKAIYRCDNIYHVDFNYPMTLDGVHDSKYYVHKNLNAKAKTGQRRSNVVLIDGVIVNQRT